MASFETYLNTAKDIHTKMKDILAIDASEFVKNPEYFGEIRLVMREILPLSNQLLETMRTPMKNYYVEELKKTSNYIKKGLEREEHLKQLISGMDTVTIIKVAKEADNQIVEVKPKHPIVKVKEHVTEYIEGRGFKCNEISGLPDELEPWYGQKYEHGKVLHKRIGLWLDSKNPPKKQKPKKGLPLREKVAKKESNTIADVS